VSRPATVALVVLVLVLGAWALVVAVILPYGLNLASRRVLAVVVGVPVVVMAGLAWLSLGRNAAPHSLPAVVEGLPAIGVALAPLVGILAVGIAMNGQPGIGPLSATALLWGVIAPLAAIYPGLTAFIAPRSRAEMAVVGVAVAAPAFALAIRLLMEPITAGCPGCQPNLEHGFVVRASLPAFVLMATFLAVEVASALMRRPGWPWAVAGVVLGAVTFGAGGLLSVIVWSLIDTPYA
jgi:hypothetical protein